MYTDIHSDFISESLIEILKSGINACNSLNGGIESFPMAEYFMQSLFLKLTGALEQKMKCICWELATNNYSYRYDFLHNKNYGECSSYDEKNNIFNDIIRCIKEIDSKFELYRIWDDIEIETSVVEAERLDLEKKIEKARNKHVLTIIEKRQSLGNPMNDSEIDKLKNGIYNKPFPEEDFLILLSSIKRDEWFQKQLSIIKEILNKSQLKEWFPRENSNYITKLNIKFKSKDFAIINNKGMSLLGGGMVGFYKTVVYDHRNRCAHNTMSYQRNLPSLTKIADNNYMYYNYFFRYTLIVLMDSVISKLYNYYRELAVTSRFVL